MLEKLNQYKELIAIIVFFLGGFFWIESEFPNKSDLKAELSSVHCLLEGYMKLTQLQIRNQEFEKQIADLGKRLSTAPENGTNALPLSPAMHQEFEQLRSDLADKRNDMKINAAQITQVRDELARNVCGKVMP